MLVPHEPKHLLALVESERAFERASGITLASGLRDFLLAGSDEFMKKLRAATKPDPWHFGFGVVHKIDNCMIGFASFTAPPDSDCAVEIAYGIAPSYWGKGCATEAARALINYAINDGRVRTIRAHTLAQTNASTRVLEKCGFKKVSKVVDSENNLVWRWETNI